MREGQFDLVFGNSTIFWSVDKDNSQQEHPGLNWSQTVTRTDIDRAQTGRLQDCKTRAFDSTTYHDVRRSFRSRSSALFCRVGTRSYLCGYTNKLKVILGVLVLEQAFPRSTAERSRWRQLQWNTCMAIQNHPWNQKIKRFLAKAVERSVYNDT